MPRVGLYFSECDLDTSDRETAFVRNCILHSITRKCCQEILLWNWQLKNFTRKL